MDSIASHLRSWWNFHVSLLARLFVAASSRSEAKLRNRWSSTMSPTTMDSTFKLNRSMRESAEKIDAFCQSTVTGNFFSIDRQAIRLWSSDKQIKAVHFTEAEYNPEVIGLEHLQRIDGFAAYLQSGKSSHKFFSTFKVWSSSLQALYQVSIQ